jgi:predicted DNA-binding transcriptional regulator AlpA
MNSEHQRVAVLPGGLAPSLDTKQAALYTGLAAATLETLRTRGGGPRFIKYGRNRVAYRQSDLDTWMDARAQDSTSEAA